MRIAILLMNRGRGSGEVARQHVQELLREGHEVIFMHPGVGDGVVGAHNIDVPLHGDTTPVHEHLPSAGADQQAVSEMEAEEAFAFVADYEAALEEIADGVDIFFGHHANLPAIAVHRVATRHGKPYVLFLHGTGIEPRHHGGFVDEVWAEIKDAIASANGVLVTTEYVRDSLVLPMVDVKADRFLVLPCGVELDDFKPSVDLAVLERFNLPDRYVICPGALTTSKGPQNVVDASREFSDIAPIVFIGDGELRSDLEERLGDRGVFLGFVSNEDKIALINSATVLTAAPEKLEHFGIIYIEALSAGTVPVAYQGGGVDSIIVGDAGVLTERSPEALGAAVRTVLLDEEKTEAMAVSCRNRAVAEFGSVQLGQRLSEWLVSINGSSVSG